MSLFLSSIAICAVAIFMFSTAVVVDVLMEGRNLERAKRMLERSGLRASADARTGTLLEGTRDDVAMTIAVNVSRPLPGTRSQPEVSDPVGTLLTVPGVGPDTMVCRADLRELIMGPITSVTLHRTGDATFDARFRVFCTESDTGLRAFLSPSVRETLTAAGLQWLRRQDGKVEVFLGELTPNQIPSIAELGVVLAKREAPSAHSSYRGSDAEAEKPLVIPPRDEAYTPLRLYPPLLIGHCAAVLFGVLGGTILPFVFGDGSLFAEVACPAGFVARVWNGVDDSAGIECVRTGAPSVAVSLLLYFAWGTFVASFPLALSLLATLKRIVDIARRPGPRDLPRGG